MSAPFCPCRLVQGWSHWVLQCHCGILHLACSRCLINVNTPTPTKTQRHTWVFVPSGSALLYFPRQSSSRSYCNHLHTGSWQRSYPALRKTTQLLHTVPSRSRASISVLLNLKDHSLPELWARACTAQLPALPSPDSGWHLQRASFWAALSIKDTCGCDARAIWIPRRPSGHHPFLH